MSGPKPSSALAPFSISYLSTAAGRPPPSVGSGCSYTTSMDMASGAGLRKPVDGVDDLEARAFVQGTNPVVDLVGDADPLLLHAQKCSKSFTSTACGT